MKLAEIHGPGGMVIETRIESEWSHDQSNGVSTTFGIFLRNRPDGPLEWVRDPGYVLQEKCQPSSNE